MKYKKFWVTKERLRLFPSGGIENYQYIAFKRYAEGMGDGVEEVIEVAALEACQKRLDDSLNLLKAIGSYIDTNFHVRKEIDTFLSQIKDEGKK